MSWLIHDYSTVQVGCLSVPKEIGKVRNISNLSLIDPPEKDQMSVLSFRSSFKYKGMKLDNKFL